MTIKRTIIGDKEKLIQDKTNMVDWMEKFQDISEMSFEDIESHIDTNVKDLASARTYLKKISKVVLAMDKLLMKIIYKKED